jgi:hypothetical protein
MCSSACDGVEIPEGWQWQQTIAAAFLANASFTTSRGWTEAPEIVPRNNSTYSMSLWRLSKKSKEKIS